MRERDHDQEGGPDGAPRSADEVGERQAEGHPHGDGYGDRPDGEPDAVEERPTHVGVAQGRSIGVEVERDLLGERIPPE